MKVVLFCGGMGLRLRESGENIPKPLAAIGYRPILWHVMKYFAHYGHKDFILCLGYRGDLVKEYFLNYNECLSNDFVLTRGGAEIKLINSDIFEYMRSGEELVNEPFQRLIAAKQLTAYEYDGFFAAMDTFKDKQNLDDLYEGGNPPWEVWKEAGVK